MALGWRGQYLRYREFFLNVFTVYKTRPDLKMFLEILLSATTVSFFALFALRPTLLTIASLIQEVRTREDTVKKMDEKIRNLQLARDIAGREARRVSLVEGAVPESPKPEGFIRQIEGLAASGQITLAGVSIGQVTLLGEESKAAQETNLSPLPEGAKGLTFSLTVSGPYPSLEAFVSDLEKVRRPVKIDIVVINSTLTETEKILVLAISGRTPYLGPK